MEDDVQASSLPEVNSRQLRAVLAVAEYRSFIAAAAFLKTSQPALTRTIKQIEAVLGASLFSRSTRQVSITEAGKEFAALAESLFGELAHVLSGGSATPLSQAIDAKGIKMKMCASDTQIAAVLRCRGTSGARLTVRSFILPFRLIAIAQSG